MTARLIAAVEAALRDLKGEFDAAASVVVQFPAGILHEVKAALAELSGPTPVDTPVDTTPPAPLETPAPPMESHDPLI
jgi:hypothetical protein